MATYPGMPSCAICHMSVCAISGMHICAICHMPICAVFLSVPSGMPICATPTPYSCGHSSPGTVLEKYELIALIATAAQIVGQIKCWFWALHIAVRTSQVPQPTCSSKSSDWVTPIRSYFFRSSDTGSVTILSPNLLNFQSDAMLASREMQVAHAINRQNTTIKQTMQLENKTMYNVWWQKNHLQMLQHNCMRKIRRNDIFLKRRSLTGTFCSIWIIVWFFPNIFPTLSEPTCSCGHCFIPLPPCLPSRILPQPNRKEGGIWNKYESCFQVQGAL